jgi:Flp pilus assembly protein TadD
VNGPTLFEFRPFTALTDEQSAKQLADALTNQLVDGLGRLPNVRLLVASGEGNAAPSQTKYSINGTISTGPTSSRVDARIVEISTGQIITTTSFVAPLRPLDEMEDEMLGGIGDDLSVGINKLRYTKGTETPESQRALRLAEEARTRIDLRTEPARAIVLFEEASSLSPDSLDIAGWYANALVAIATAKPPNSDERKSYLQRASAILELRKSEVPYHRLLIYAQCQLSNYEGNPEAALAACDQALRVSPWSARAHKEVGTAYMQLGQLDRALRSFNQAERLDHRHSVRSTWEIKAGIACLILDRYQEASDWFRRAAVISKDDPWIFGLSAVAYRRLGNVIGAREAIYALKNLTKEDSTKDSVRSVLNFYHFSNNNLNKKLHSIIDEFEELFDSDG